MSRHWPKVVLSEVLRRSEEMAVLQADTEYSEITVRLWGKGVVERGRVLGAEIAGNKRFVAREGQFITSRIDARNGAMGIVPTHLDGAVVTNDFPLFNIDAARLLPDYFRWLSGTQGFVELCLRASEGTTNRVRLKEDRFLALEIPLPPLAEQRRIVARIEELAAQIHEAGALREQATSEADALIVGMAHRADLDVAGKEANGWRRCRLEEVMVLVEDAHKVSVERSYPNLGIYSFGRGLFHKPPIEGMATSATSLHRVHKEQFIYSRLFAFEGAYGMVTDEFDGAYVSNEYPTFECKPECARPEFLSAYFKAPSVWKQVATGSKGLGDRRQRVQPAQVLAHEVWLPSLSWQARIAEIQTQVDTLKRHQTETAAELDALLPAILDHAFRGEL